MQRQTIVMIVLAMGLGTAASAALSHVMGPQIAVESDPATSRIYVALRDIEDGESVDERNVMLMQWPTRGLPPGTTGSLEAIKDRMAVGRITSGQPIQTGQVRVPEAPATVDAEPAETPATIAVQLPRDQAGPWVVSVSERPQVESLDHLLQQAVELAKRSVSDPVEPVVKTPAPAATPVATVVLPPAPRPASSAWMSTIVTPEGAKVMRWRRADETSPRGDGASANTLTREIPGDCDPLALHGATSLVVNGDTLETRAFDSALVRGRPFVIVVFDVRNTQSREELSLVRRLADTYRHRGLTVIGIALDDDLAALRSFVKRNSLGWPVLVGPAAVQWAAQAQIHVTPSLLVAHADGRMVTLGRRTDEIAAAVAVACGYDPAAAPAAREARRTE